MRLAGSEAASRFKRRAGGVTLLKRGYRLEWLCMFVRPTGKPAQAVTTRHAERAMTVRRRRELSLPGDRTRKRPSAGPGLKGSDQRPSGLGFTADLIGMILSLDGAGCLIGNAHGERRNAPVRINHELHVIPH